MRPSEDEQALRVVVELFRAQLPRAALEAMAAAPPTAYRAAVLETLALHRSGVEALFRARSARFIPTLLRVWGREEGPANYLDVGCGSGSRTRAVARAFGVPEEGVRGYDVTARWDAASRGLFVFDGRRLDDCADGSFEMVTLNMVLHHIDEPEPILAEVRRVLRPGGGLLVREHDSPDERSDRVLDEFHWLVANVLGDSMCSGNYRSRARWRSLLADAGLCHVRGSDPAETMLEDPLLRGYVDLFTVD